MIIHSNQKKGYSAIINGMLKIKDKSGRLFYVRNCSGYVHFNLPSGTFDSNAELTELAKPIEYRTIALPEAEKDRPFPSDIEVRYGNNKNKATIFLTGKKYIIILDTMYKTIGRLYRTFVKYHELGHHYYKTEALADRFSYMAMITEGYNPSQIFYAAYLTLNKLVSKNRIREMLFTTIKQNTYEC